MQNDAAKRSAPPTCCWGKAPCHLHGFRQRASSCLNFCLFAFVESGDSDLDGVAQSHCRWHLSLSGGVQSLVGAELMFA